MAKFNSLEGLLVAFAKAQQMFFFFADANSNGHTVFLKKGLAGSFGKLLYFIRAVNSGHVHKKDNVTRSNWNEQIGVREGQRILQVWEHFLSVKVEQHHGTGQICCHMQLRGFGQCFRGSNSAAKQLLEKTGHILYRGCF